MPDVPDIRTPVADLGHESLRQSVVNALDDLGSSFDLTDTLLTLVDALFAALDESLATSDGLRADVDALTARVGELENPTVPLP